MGGFPAIQPGHSPGQPPPATAYGSFQKHLQRKHGGTLHDHSTSNAMFQDGDQDERNSSELSFVNTDNQANDLKRSAALFLLKTLEIGRVSQTVLNTVIEGVTELFQAHLKEESVMPFAGLESQYLQRMFFKEELNMVVCGALRLCIN